MFRKVHVRLAALCAGITIFILLVMSCGFLYISERGLRTSSFAAFQNDMDALITSLEQQTIITHEWLSRIEDNGTYLINVIDNGVPFLYNERNTPEQKRLFSAAWETCNSRLEVEPLLSAFDTWHMEYPFSSSGGTRNDYYACVMEAMNWFCCLWFSSRGRRSCLVKYQENSARAADARRFSPRKRSLWVRIWDSLESIQSEGLRMSRLIDDMLLLTQAGDCRWTIQKRPSEPDTLLLDTFEAFEAMAAEQSIRFHIELPEEAVPPVLCDPERIRQVLSILLHNAFSYTKKGGLVRLSLRYDGKTVRFLVADNGIGIPDEEKKKIFERFYRADQARSEKGHFGLGLCIAAEIVRAHHGRIQVSDTPGGGSTFTITL